MRFSLARIRAAASSRLARLGELAPPVRIAATLARALAGLVIFGHAALVLTILIASIALLWVDPRVTALMVYRGITAGQKSLPIQFVPLRRIPPVARTMVIRLEDYRFYHHPGVDLGAIRDAWLINASIGRTVVGGSTIPMQLARNFFLTPRKTYFRKYVEALIAVEMDLILPKDRILELYLNSIEWGKGVFGIGAAAAYYYHANVADLGLDELRRLVTIITNPLRYNVQNFARSRQMAERYDYLVSRFPDPSAAPQDSGPVAPVPDAPSSVAPAPEAAVPDAPVPAPAAPETQPTGPETQPTRPGATP